MSGPITRRYYVSTSLHGSTGKQGSLSERVAAFQQHAHIYCQIIAIALFRGKGDGTVVVAPIMCDERKVLLTVLHSSLCSVLQLVLAFAIPFWWAGGIGLLSLVLNIALAREVWLRRIQFLHLAIFAPIPTVILEYAIYLMLVEALDEDNYRLADEDDLERSIESSHVDRWMAWLGLGLNLLQVVLAFGIACRVLALRAVYRGQQAETEHYRACCGLPTCWAIHCCCCEQDDGLQQQQPWVLQLIAVLNEVNSPVLLNAEEEAIAPSASCLQLTPRSARLNEHEAPPWVSLRPKPRPRTRVDAPDETARGGATAPCSDQLQLTSPRRGRRGLLRRTSSSGELSPSSPWLFCRALGNGETSSSSPRWWQSRYPWHSGSIQSHAGGHQLAQTDRPSMKGQLVAPGSRHSSGPAKRPGKTARVEVPRSTSTAFPPIVEAEATAPSVSRPLSRLVPGDSSTIRTQPSAPCDGGGGVGAQPDPTVRRGNVPPPLPLL